MHEKDDISMIGLMFGCDMEMRDLEEHLPGEKEPYHDTLLLQVRIQQ
jgi:hypothetical protein